MNEQLWGILGRHYELLKSRAYEAGDGWNKWHDAVEAFCDRIEAMYGFWPNYNCSDWRSAYRHRVVDDVMVNP